MIRLSILGQDSVVSKAVNVNNITMGIFQSTLNDPHKNRLDGSRKVLLTVLALVIFLNYGKHKQNQIIEIQWR